MEGLRNAKDYDDGFVPSWMAKGKTLMLQKDRSKGNIPSNYRSMTCLPVLRKLMTCTIADEMYGHVNQQYLLPKEQKVCRKRSRVPMIYFVLIQQLVEKLNPREKTSQWH